MPLTLLARSRWQEFFDTASRAAGARRATVEVTGLQLGDRIAADQAALTGMTYEPQEDTLTVFVQGLEHRIRQPKAIHVDADAAALRSIEAVDVDGVHHIIQFSTALELPAP